MRMEANQPRRTRLIVTLPFLEEKPAYVDRWVHEVYPHAYLVSPHQVPTSKFPYREFRKVIVDANPLRGVYRLLVPPRFDRVVVLAHPPALGAVVHGLLCCAHAPFTFQVDVLVRGLPETLTAGADAPCSRWPLGRRVRGFALDSLYVRSLILGGDASPPPPPPLKEGGSRNVAVTPHRRSTPGRDVVPPPRPRKTAFNPVLDLSAFHPKES